MAEEKRHHEFNAHQISQLNYQLQGLSQKQLQAQKDYGKQMIESLKQQQQEVLNAQRVESARLAQFWRQQIEADINRAMAELARQEAVNKSQMPEQFGSGDMTKQIESSCLPTITGLLRPNIPDSVRDKIKRMYNNKNDELKRLAANFLEQNPPFLVRDGCSCERECAVQALLDYRLLAEDSRIISIEDGGRTHRQLMSYKTFGCKQHPGGLFKMIFDETSIDEQRIIEVRAE